jgi:hypothetical protein
MDSAMMNAAHALADLMAGRIALYLASKGVKRVTKSTLLNVMCGNTRDRRRVATSLNASRERTLLDVFHGAQVSDTVLTDKFSAPPASIRGVAHALSEKYPGFRAIKRKGGLSNGHDYVFHHDGREMKVELKTSASRPRIDPTLAPWSPGVQFCQGQIAHKGFQAALRDLGEPLLRAFHTYLVERQALTLSYEDYNHMVYNIKQKPKELRRQASVLTRAWDEFSDAYLSSHAPSLEEMRSLITAAIEQKDLWVVITPAGCVYVPALRVVDLTNGRISRKTKRYVVEYDLRLKGTTEYTVPIEFRIHWKNGGQGVQNPNFMIG